MLFFHGTSRENADQIFADRHFIQSENPYDWLGAGVYFYQDAPLKALAWAQRYAIEEQGRGGEPTVIQAEIDLDEVFDLFSPDSIEFLRTVNKRRSEASAVKRSQYRPVLRRFDGERVRLLQDGTISEDVAVGANLYDCELVNQTLEMLRQTGREFSCVRQIFWEGQELYKGSYFYDHSNIQLCVVGDGGKVSFGDRIFKTEPTRVEVTDRMLNIVQEQIRWPI